MAASSQIRLYDAAESPETENFINCFEPKLFLLQNGNEMNSYFSELIAMLIIMFACTLIKLANCQWQQCPIGACNLFDYPIAIIFTLH